MRTSNPYLTEAAIGKARREASTSDTQMTVAGTVNKILILLLVVAGCATLSWKYVTADTLVTTKRIMPLLTGGGIAAFVLSLIISFKPTSAPILAFPFAICEGLVLGAGSAMYATAVYAEIVMHAVMLTFGTASAMFILWHTGVIVVTQRMRSIVASAFGAIFLVYLASFILGFFGVEIPMIHGSGPIGIGFSALVVVICSFMLLVDFDMIERMSNQGAPKSMEWFGAFALLITLVWLYMEFLRLLSKLRDD